MIEIDGSMHSGSGTLLRYGVALATLTRGTLHMTRIRAKRPKPGLRAQHLNAVTSCCAISGGQVDGAEVGSQEIVFRPGDALKGGDFEFDIGTAGSAAMAAFTLIPPCLFARETSRLTITGGLFQDFAPSFFHMQKVLVPLLQRMGADVRLDMLRPGYVPKGGGRLRMVVSPRSVATEAAPYDDTGDSRNYPGHCPVVSSYRAGCQPQNGRHLQRDPETKGL